jgi:hypothetical protein
MYEVKHPWITSFVKHTDLLVDLARWVLFYFIQDQPWGEPITVWELVTYCTLRLLRTYTEVSYQELSIVEWLTLPADKCSQLDTYYQERLSYMAQNVLKYETGTAKPLVDLYFQPK